MTKKQTLGEINHNLLNIRHNHQNKWRGQVAENKGFCVFENDAYGVRAGYKVLTTYISKGINTIESIIKRWAPPSENNTERYIQFVSDETLIPRTHILEDRNIHDYWTKIIILQAMIKFECGKHVDENQINLYISYPEKY